MVAAVKLAQMGEVTLGRKAVILLALAAMMAVQVRIASKAALVAVRKQVLAARRKTAATAGQAQTVVQPTLPQARNRAEVAAASFTLQTPLTAVLVPVALVACAFGHGKG